MNTPTHPGPLHLLVANPSARSGKAIRGIEKALAQLKRRGMAAELLHTQPHGRTVQVVADRLARGGIDVVICLGGDGTFHEVASGILKAPLEPATPLPPLGMLPAGTANDQGRSFGIRRGEMDRNVGIIQAGYLTWLDVGVIERRGPDGAVSDRSYFFDSCGFGIQPDILSTRNRDRERVKRIPVLREIYRDQAVYFGASLRKLLESYIKPVKFSADVIADGTRHRFERVTDIIISSTPIYGGAWVVDRHAKPDDGKFELVPIQGRRDWASKGLRDLAASPIWQEQLNWLRLTHSQGFAASHFELELYRPERRDLRAQVDGEEWGVGDRYRIEAQPRRLPLITPEGFVPPWRPR